MLVPLLPVVTPSHLSRLRVHPPPHLSGQGQCANLPPDPRPAAVLDVLSVTILLPCWLYCLKISLRLALSLPPPHFTSPASGSACGRASILQTHSCDGPFHGSRTLDGHASSRPCSHAASSALRETRTAVGRGGGAVSSLGQPPPGASPRCLKPPSSSLCMCDPCPPPGPPTGSACTRGVPVTAAQCHHPVAGYHVIVFNQNPLQNVWSCATWNINRKDQTGTKLKHISKCRESPGT